jgi:nicotinate-nucleotide pyrophosphorylase (carboxylating)
VLAGGGRNHRFGLDDGILIKDNHIALAGGVAAAIERARESAAHLHKIEVEVANEKGLREAIDARADIIMLDNFNPEDTARMVAIARELAPTVLLESSAALRSKTCRQYADAGVDLVSVGALTHSARAMDISFKIQPG